MTTARRGTIRAWVACAAVLIGAAMISSGCGSAPTGEQQGGGVAQEAAQAPEKPPTGAAAPDESAPAESARPAQTPGPSTPPAGRVAPSQPVTEPPTPVQAAPPAERPTPVQAAPVAAVDWTGSAQKWVPIFSVDNAGVNIGAAQIAGPKGQVAKVKAVAELGLAFKGLARIYAYIPVSSISTKLDRVQGVSVWAIGGVELVNF